MKHNRLNYADTLKAMIYEDFLQSLESVRAGENPDTAFRAHEQRVARLRSMVAASEAERTHLRLVS